jgi:hypothetical protein
VYEAMKRIMLQRDTMDSNGREGAKKQPLPPLTDRYGAEEALEEAAMEVAADGGNAFPAPQFHRRQAKKSKKG